MASLSLRAPLDMKYGIGQLRPGTDPDSIAPALAGVVPALRSRPRLQFDCPLPEAVLAATAEALSDNPHVQLRARDRSLHPDLSWLARFAHLRHLHLDVWHATSFDMVADFENLRSLHLGRTRSAKPGLGFINRLERLVELTIEGHGYDWAPLHPVTSLRGLHLHATHAADLEPVRNQPSLEILTVHLGAIPDISLIAELPRLRGLELHQTNRVRSFDVDFLGDCVALEALSLSALRDLTDLAALRRLPARHLRFLILDGLPRLATLADLVGCQQLEELALFDTRPADRRLDVILELPNLNHVVVGDEYPPGQIAALRQAFRGQSLAYRGEMLTGTQRAAKVSWRAPVSYLLDEAA